ncbi:hypothetical protein Clacol_003655 [Clathrus columnatus]|uniref:FAD-binding FR-type domain-containing protein n=1 Tax=Clathrus columnatus TaxID=1419009 RepID=A0AAV5A9V1_9AGAM|nr:hypothetical protein Clacol_003655 [Clathrus columnatus]
MSNPGTPFVDPNFYIYELIDPPYQIKFTIVWTVVTALCILIAAPKLFKTWQNGRLWQTWAIRENVHGVDYKPLESPERIIPRTVKKSCFSRPASVILKYGLFTVPYLNLNLGQALLLAAYLATTLVCILYKSPILLSPNRAGFIALAQLPFIFLFAAKNSLLSVLLGRGYEKLNFLHRWAGRILFLSITIHGGLWINNDRTAGTPIIGSAKETLGVAAYGLLGTILITSFPIVRKHAYQMFTVVQIKEAVLVPVDNQMTLIHIQNCDGGWIAGQHLRLRVFFSGRMYESHPLTIANAPAPISCTTSGEIILGARVSGDWTYALNEAARLAEKDLRVNVMLDGPYGGSSIDLGDYENALLVAGGSGITFTLGLLDDIVGRVVNMKRKAGEKTKRIDFAWCIKSYGSISWFAPMLADIALKAQDSSISLRINIFVTCLCNPEAVPVIPNCEVIVEKPQLSKLLDAFLNRSTDLETGKLSQTNLGGLAVAVSGPKSLTAEAQNAIAGLSASRTRTSVGDIALHTEDFSL